MKLKTPVQVFLVSASIAYGGGVSGAPDASHSRTRARRALPATIVSEASLEYFIGMTGRLLQNDTAKDISSLNARLDALKRQQQALAQQIAQGQVAAGQPAHDRLKPAKRVADIDILRAQLAQVELEMKEILQNIARKREEEQDIKDDIAAAQDALQHLNEALEKAASQYTAIIGATSMNSFVRSLSAEKKRETQSKVRRALAQLAEARRARLSSLSISEPAFHPAPKPLTTK